MVDAVSLNVLADKADTLLFFFFFVLSNLR